MSQGLLHKDQRAKVLKEYITFSLCACTRKYLEQFVQANVELVNENFENIGVVVSSKLIELRKSPSPALIEEILKLEASKDIKQHTVSTTVTEAQQCADSASCCFCSKRSWFGSHPPC